MVLGGLWPRAQGPLLQSGRQAPELAQPDMRVQQIHLVEQTEAGDTWQVIADEAEFYDAQHIIMVHRLRAELLATTAQPLHIVAEHGQIDHTTGNLILRGRVHLTYLDAYTIVTDTLYWHAASQSVQTPEAVTVDGALVHIVGLGLLGQIVEQRFVLQDAVHAIFRTQ